MKSIQWPLPSICNVLQTSRDSGIGLVSPLNDSEAKTYCFWMHGVHFPEEVFHEVIIKQVLTSLFDLQDTVQVLSMKFRCICSVGIDLMRS